jgi:hypothetical protein
VRKVWQTRRRQRFLLGECRRFSAILAPSRRAYPFSVSFLSIFDFDDAEMEILLREGAYPTLSPASLAGASLKSGRQPHERAPSLNPGSPLPRRAKPLDAGFDGGQAFLGGFV